MKAQAFYLDGLVPYDAMLAVQDSLVAKRLGDSIPDTVLFLEHTPVITCGRRTEMKNLLKTPDELRSSGIPVFQSPRGGDITHHAAGQIVMYPILRLEGKEADVHTYTFGLEEAAIRTAADFGVKAYRRNGMNGAWTDDGKIAAIGVKLKRWVTSHGLSFNVNIDLAGFEAIVPCGLKGERVTSLQRILLSACPPMFDVRERMKTHFCAVFSRELSVRRVNGRQFLMEQSAE